MAGKIFGGKRLKMIAAAVLAVALVLTPAITPSVPAEAASLSELQAKQKAAKAKQQQTASKLKELKADQAKKQEYQKALEGQISSIQANIDELNSQIQELDGQITNKEAEISAKQISINQNFDQFKDRIRAIYLMGDTSNLEIILGAKNMSDFLDKTELLRTISDHDTELLNELKTEMADIQVQKEEIEATRVTVADSKTELDSQSKELSNLVVENQEVLRQLNADVVTANSENNQAARDFSKVDNEIDAWYKDYYAKQAKNNKNNQGSGGYVSKGQFTWPVPGYTKLTSYWGDGRNHKGIDIAGSGIYGKKIVAADNGKVIKTTSGWGGGYGISLDIDHGGGYLTRYGHCSKLAVGVGDVVTKGQVIAYVGNTGDSSGPHLHFEVRINGVANNPMKWFS